MRKMPPLPTKKSINNANNKPLIELVSARIALPQRYNSIERVRESKKELFGEEKKEVEREEMSEVPTRKNYLIRRPISASERRDFSKD